MKIAINNNGRKYGYFYWPKKFDLQIEAIVGKATQIRLFFNNADHGLKRVDWKNRRISIGARWTRNLPTNHAFYSVSGGRGTLNVDSCRNRTI